MTSALEKPKALAARVGLTERAIRQLITSRQLAHVEIGSRVYVPEGAWERYIEERTVQPCHDETRDHGSASSTSAAPSTSCGPRPDAAASARLGEAAEVAFAEFMRARTQHAGPRDPAETLITDVLIEYLEGRGPKVRSQDRIAYAVEPLAVFWSGRTLADISDKTTGAYGRWRAKSPSTVRRELGVLRAAINYGYKRGQLTRIVAVELPAEAPAKDRWLTRQEAARLLRAARSLPKARGYLPLFILIGLYTGRRKEAILSLRWSSVSLKGGMIDFRRPGEAETKKRRGRCRIPRQLLPHLIRAHRFGTDLGYVVGADACRVRQSFQRLSLKSGDPGFPRSLQVLPLETGCRL